MIPTYSPHFNTKEQAEEVKTALKKLIPSECFIQTEPAQFRLKMGDSPPWLFRFREMTDEETESQPEFIIKDEDLVQSELLWLPIIKIILRALEKRE